jgi:glycine/D-amino acid oxidase-like deaminating enzyme
VTIPVATASIWQPPVLTPQPLPDRASVVVIGAGVTGLSIAQRLISQGVDVLVVEAKDHIGCGMATRGMGIASVLLLDPPFRLIQAVGLDVAREITRFTRESVALWGPRLEPVGVGYLPKGETETQEVQENLAAMNALGLEANPWTDHAYPGIGQGWTQPLGGSLDGTAVVADLAHGIAIATGQRVVSIDDDQFDLAVRTQNGCTVRAELVIMSGGAQLTDWATSKFHPVRHQALATEALSPCVPFPIHMQYGYTSVRQAVGGQVVVSGCRWATPHLEVGETDDTVVHPAVHGRLHGFIGQHLPQLAEARITHQWSSIMTFTCDGLPVIGPLPGRPRIISCGGFGAFSPSLSLRAAKAVVDGITTGESPGVPECFSTRRFE